MALLGLILRRVFSVSMVFFMPVLLLFKLVNRLDCWFELLGTSLLCGTRRLLLLLPGLLSLLSPDLILGQVAVLMRLDIFHRDLLVDQDVSQIEDDVEVFERVWEFLEVREVVVDVSQFCEGRVDARKEVSETHAAELYLGLSI